MKSMTKDEKEQRTRDWREKKRKTVSKSEQGFKESAIDNTE